MRASANPLRTAKLRRLGSYPHFACGLSDRADPKVEVSNTTPTKNSDVMGFHLINAPIKP